MRPAYLWFFIYVIYTLGVRPAHLCIFPFQGDVPVEFLHLGVRPAHLYVIFPFMSFAFIWD